MTAEYDPSHNCSDPALRQIIQYISLKWGAIEPCAGRTWEECLVTIDDREALYFNDPKGTTRLYWLS